MSYYPSPANAVPRMQRIDARGDYPRSTPIQDLIDTIPGNYMYMCYRKASAVDPIDIYLYILIHYMQFHRYNRPRIARFFVFLNPNLQTQFLSRGKSPTPEITCTYVSKLYIYIIINVLHIQGTHKRYAADKL